MLKMMVCLNNDLWKVEDMGIWKGCTQHDLVKQFIDKGVFEAIDIAKSLWPSHPLKHEWTEFTEEDIEQFKQYELENT